MAKPLNTDPFATWNGPLNQDNPFAPHNGFDGDNPFKPWNEPFGSEEDLNDQERKDYGLSQRRSRFDEDICDY